VATAMDVGKATDLAMVVQDMVWAAEKAMDLEAEEVQATALDMEKAADQEAEEVQATAQAMEKAPDLEMAEEATVLAMAKDTDQAMARVVAMEEATVRDTDPDTEIESEAILYKYASYE